MPVFFHFGVGDQISSHFLFAFYPNVVIGSYGWLLDVDRVKFLARQAHMHTQNTPKPSEVHYGGWHSGRPLYSKVMESGYN